MRALVIHAPNEKARTERKKNFEETFKTGIGEGYAIARNLAAQCRDGCAVVLLCKDGRKRAEGMLLRLVPTEQAGNGIQRYDVYMEDLREVPYHPEKLNRNGVAVI